MDNPLAAALLTALPQPALFVGQDQRITAANAPARRLLGEGLTARHFALSLRHPQAIATIEAALGSGMAGQGRLTNLSANDEATFRLSVTPVSGGGISGALCLFEDISDAEQIGQMRREFVANVSHELRTPLTALLGFIETLRGAARDDATAREKFLQIMAREAGRMNRLVSDLLALSQVESTERVRPGDVVDIVAVVQSTAAALRPVADQAGTRITIEGQTGPIWVQGDADQLVQVFQNLIENAVKYGGGSPVQVNVARIDDRSIGGKAVALAVSDRGEGIDSIHLPRLTERFYRVDNHRSREQGGTGLGLAIVKHIVNRHRGRLRVESLVGQGSTFTVILPESRDNP
jgi:two-component system, OmpR family, phosphate regulon sensor histidine kinase PhoR